MKDLKTTRETPEIGRLQIDIIEIKRGSKRVFSAEKYLFPETGLREHYKTVCFKELALSFPCDESFRKSTQKINRVLWRNADDAVQYRTLANIVEHEGALIQEHIGKKAGDILKSSGFSAEEKLIDDNKGFSSMSDGISIAECTNIGDDSSIVEGTSIGIGINIDNTNITENASISDDIICKMIEELNIGKEKEIQIELSELNETFEDPKSIKANVSLDDVLAKKQKESDRKKGSKTKEKRESVKNTVAHIQSSESNTSILNATSIKQMMIFVLAFAVRIMSF